jgi:hypothetical protein
MSTGLSIGLSIGVSVILLWRPGFSCLMSHAVVMLL